MKDAYDYKIIKNIDAEALTRDAVKSFKEGWEPVGGISVTTYRVIKETNNDKDGEVVLLYAQALVKR